MNPDLLRELALAQRQRNLSFLQPGFRHEIAGPLNALTLHVGLLVRAVDSATLDPERTSRWVGILDEELGRLNELTDLWLEGSAPDRPDPCPTRVVPVFDRLRRLVVPACAELGIDLEIDPPDADMELPIRHLRLEDLLLDLTVAALQRFDTAEKEGALEWSAGIEDEDLYVAVTDDAPPARRSRNPAAWKILSNEGQWSSRLKLSRLLMDLTGGRLASERTDDGRNRGWLRWPRSPNDE